jgi:1-acyl-sn-glycerol-3-phosphate acyltransferase
MQLRWRIGYWLLYPTARIVFGMRIEGRQLVPRTGPLIVAPNHLSNIDAPIIGVGVGVRELHYLAKEGLFARRKVFAWLISHLNAVPLRKGAASIESIRAAMKMLREGKAVVIFPEGTRNRAGGFLEPQVGLGYLAAKSGVRILPTYIGGTDKRMADLFLRKSEFLVRFGEPIDPMAIDGDMGKKDRYRVISEEVMKSIRALSQK